MRALAQAIGYSPGATYKHFQSKKEIFECLAEESFAALLNASEGVKEVRGEDPVQRLRRGMLAYIEFGLQQPEHYSFAFLLQQPDPKPRPKSQKTYVGLRHRVEGCIAARIFRRGDAELMAQSLWAAAHGITSLLIQKPLFPWVAKRKLIAQVVDSAIQGLMDSPK